MLRTLIVTNFLPPDTPWPAVPVMPMDIGEACTCLASCDDGALLAVLHLPAHKLVNEIRQDSLFTKVAELKAKSEWAYLIISEGLQPTVTGSTKVAGVDTKWAWAAVQGALATVQELGVIVQQIPDEAALGPTVERLAKRDRATKRLKPIRVADMYSPGEQMLLALPGVGETTLQKIYGYCGERMADILMALSDPRAAIPGIGPKTSADIRAVFGLTGDDYLTTIAPGDTITPASAEQKKAA